MRTPIIVFLAVVYSNVLLGQTHNYKEKAIEAFDNQNYPKAIEFLHKAVKENPDDKELYYYLGHFYHYNAYDSRPLAGYNSQYSDTVFFYLEKALEIDPNYGDAKYFYTAECGAAVSQAIRVRDYEKIKYYYQKAAEKGGFPDWSIEYGKHLLSPVEPDGILFTMGDFAFNVCRYLQVCENYRTDITVISWGHLNRPFYIMELKNGKSRKNIKFDLTEEQILDMHPYKWDTTLMEIDVPERICERYSLDKDYKMKWEIVPDLFGSRSYLGSETAIILSIIESNQWERPIFFQSGITESIVNGIHKNVTRYGLVEKLVPMDTDGSNWQYQVESLENFVNPISLYYYNSIIDTNQPRVSAQVLYAYYKSLCYLAEYYKRTDEISKIDNIIRFYTEYLDIGVFPEYEKSFLDGLQLMKD
ncbi:MAG: tetratricopeptide repeat protein [Bacteroidales bacterium]|nr:tetratricopeptide repeat protein [Bacteroidales bacterium]